MNLFGDDAQMVFCWLIFLCSSSCSGVCCGCALQGGEEVCWLIWIQALCWSHTSMQSAAQESLLLCRSRVSNGFLNQQAIQRLNATIRLFDSSISRPKNKTNHVTAGPAPWGSLGRWSALCWAKDATVVLGAQPHVRSLTTEGLAEKTTETKTLGGRTTHEKL